MKLWGLLGPLEGLILNVKTLSSEKEENSRGNGTIVRTEGKEGSSEGKMASDVELEAKELEKTCLCDPEKKLKAKSPWENRVDLQMDPKTREYGGTSRIPLQRKNTWLWMPFSLCKFSVAF